jgi:hypothetical protein
VNTTDWRAELGTKTTEILGRYGVAGRVEVESRLVWLIGNGPTVEVSLNEADAANAALNPAGLKTLAERLARDLSRARRAASRESGSTAGWQAWAKVLPTLTMVALGVWMAFRYLTPHHITSSDWSSKKSAHLSHGVQSPSAKLVEKQVLDDQNCLRTVTRIQQGGTVTPLDIDGWVVELSLVSAVNDLLPTAASLNNYFQLRPDGIERTHHAANTPGLNQTDAQQAGVLISKEPLATVSPNAASGIVITWRGQYVTPYFSESDRTEYFKVADSLFNSLHASHGALYARCIQGGARYLGSWFRGPNVGAALWMLVTEMGVVSGSVRVPSLGASSGLEDYEAPLKYLAETVGPITRRKAAYVLSTSGGFVSERVGQFATIEFPFSPANRASLASTAIAHKVWPTTDNRTIPAASAMP